MQKIIEIKTGKTKKYSYNDIVYDSKEEIYFSWYCDDLIKKGFVKKVIYQPHTYLLIPPATYCYMKENKKSSKTIYGDLLQNLCYTPDFEIFWEEHAIESYVYRVNIESKSVRGRDRVPFVSMDTARCNTRTIIDTKGKHSKHGDLAKFPLLQKLMMERHNIYVQKIVPVKLFQKTFYPERYLWTDGATKKRKLEERRYYENHNC